MTRRCRASLLAMLAVIAWFGLPRAAVAGALDDAVAADPFLALVAAALDAYGIDVISNLNDRQLARGRISEPRLGRFPDLPQNALPNSDEILVWEAEYSAQGIGGLAILPPGPVPASAHAFVQRWLQTPGDGRLFVTFAADDHDSARQVQAVADAYGYATLLFSAGGQLPLAGKAYATAAQRLAIDSSGARRYRSQVTEISFLGERVRRNSDSVFRNPGDRDDRSLARGEPPVFLKETLGDEFSESTIREIIVPGGIALGESAALAIAIAEIQFADERLALIDTDGKRWRLPAIAGPELKALFDFVQRSEAIQSDSIVDIDAERRVRISSALRDTEPGFAMLHADTQPFEFVPNLPVTKSVVIDIGVYWFAGSEDELAFETDYEVRFLAADNMALAQTRVALEYNYDSLTAVTEYVDAWGRDTGRLRESLDYAGLGASMAVVARYAGWAGLLRKLQEEQVPFLKGRYEFMKLDKSGTRTPARY